MVILSSGELPRLRVEVIEGKGRAVIASQGITSGAVVIADLVDRFQGAEAEKVDGTGLKKFLIPDRSQYADGSSSPDLMVLWGLTSIANHSDDPNCLIAFSGSGVGEVAKMVAVRDIKEGEEITHRYPDIAEYDTSEFLD